MWFEKIAFDTFKFLVSWINEISFRYKKRERLRFKETKRKPSSGYLRKRKTSYPKWKTYNWTCLVLARERDLITKNKGTWIKIKLIWGTCPGEYINIRELWERKTLDSPFGEWKAKWYNLVTIEEFLN
jgi:hypothetical protein